MLNKNYKLGSRWKLTLLIPLTVIAFFVMSCTDKDAALNDTEAAEETMDEAPEMEVFMVVEDMPTFKGGEAAVEFRKYIAQNLQYPAEAAEAGATGKIFIKFIVDKNGKVLIPEKEALAEIEGKPLGEVVVVGYTGYEGTEEPEEQYIQMLKDEVRRVVLSSPDWIPGSQRGKAVNVMFTFPVNFVLK